MDRDIDYKEMEHEAELKAKKQVANLLQRPDQLEKVEQIKKRVTRKKGSVEAMLKTAVQSNLDGVRTGMLQLKTALSDIRDIKASLDEIDKTHQGIASLGNRMKVMREENARHSQLAAAKENLKHIISVPETVSKAEDQITEGKLLDAHQSLTDLETARNDLLFETHKQSMDSSDRQMVERYFYKVGPLSNSLSKQLFIILQRAIVSIRQDPSLIVTVLRIIEREEKVDEFAANREERTGFKTPGRPKKWRERCFQTLEDAVKARVEGNQIADRETDKMWLVKHLEVTRMLVLEDLRVVKTLFEPCFPPSYGIVDRYVKMYHTEIREHLQSNIIHGLVGNEVVSLLTWVFAYNSPDFMGHRSLQIDTSRLGPVLEDSTIQGLRLQYLDTLGTNYDDWISRSLDQEVKDWMGSKEPDADAKGYYNTSLPVVLYDMIEQNLVVAATIGETLRDDVLILSIKKIEVFCNKYRAQLKKFSSYHQTDRSHNKLFIPYMIANINNCDTFQDMVLMIYERHGKGDIDESSSTNIAKAVAKQFLQVGKEGCQYLLEDVFIDLKSSFQSIMTRQWLSTTEAVETIRVTLEDYNEDFVRLREQFNDYLIDEAETRGSQYYFQALLSGKFDCKNYDDRILVAEKIIDEGKVLGRVFKDLRKRSTNESPFNALALLAEVIKLRDNSMMSLELQNLITKHPDLRAEQLVNLLTMREDYTRGEARELVVELLGEENVSTKTGIFSKLLTNVQDTFNQ